MYRLVLGLVLTCSLAFTETHRAGVGTRGSDRAKVEEAAKGCTNFQIEEAKEALKAIDASTPNWALDSFMSNSTSANCPTIASHCFALCVGKNPANASLCTSVCKLSKQPANCTDDVELKAAVGALEACSAASIAWQCLDAFIIYENKIAFCPGIPERCTRVCSKRHPGSVDCGRVCNKAPLKQAVTQPTVVTPRPKPVPRPPEPETPVEHCRKISDPVSCDNDKLCYLVGAGIVRPGLGGPSFTCCAKGFSEQCKQDIMRR